MTTIRLYRCDTCNEVFESDKGMECSRYGDTHTCEVCRYAAENKKPPTFLEIIQNAGKPHLDQILSHEWISRFPAIRLVYLEGDPPSIVPYIDIDRQRRANPLEKDEFEQIVDLVRKGFWHIPELTRIKAELKLRQGRIEQQPGFVYVAKGNGGKVDGLYKIGASRKPRERLSSLNSEFSTVCEFILQIPSEQYKALEYLIHGRFMRVQRNGEWFALTPENVNALAILAEQSGGQVYRGS